MFNWLFHIQAIETFDLTASFWAPTVYKRKCTNFIEKNVKIRAKAFRMLIQSVSKILGQTSGASHAKTTKRVHIYICPQILGFRGTAQQRGDLNLVDFYVWGHLKFPRVFSSN